MSELKKGSMANRSLAGWKWNMSNWPTKVALLLKWLNLGPKSSHWREEKSRCSSPRGLIFLTSIHSTEEFTFYLLILFLFSLQISKNISQRKWALRIVPRDEPRGIFRRVPHVSGSHWPLGFEIILTTRHGKQILPFWDSKFPNHPFPHASWL